MLEVAPHDSASAHLGGHQAVAEGYLGRLAALLALVPGSAVRDAISLLLEARASGRRIYVMGNGGSSATASHFVCDLSKTARVSGFHPVRAFALTDNTPLMTAW